MIATYVCRASLNSCLMTPFLVRHVWLIWWNNIVMEFQLVDKSFLFTIGGTNILYENFIKTFTTFSSAKFPNVHIQFNIETIKIFLTNCQQEEYSTLLYKGVSYVWRMHKFPTSQSAEVHNLKRKPEISDGTAESARINSIYLHLETHSIKLFAYICLIKGSQKAHYSKPPWFGQKASFDRNKYLKLGNTVNSLSVNNSTTSALNNKGFILCMFMYVYTVSKLAQPSECCSSPWLKNLGVRGWCLYKQFSPLIKWKNHCLNATHTSPLTPLNYLAPLDTLPTYGPYTVSFLSKPHPLSLSCSSCPSISVITEF